MSEKIHDAILVEENEAVVGEKVLFNNKKNLSKIVALILVTLLLSSTILYAILSEDEKNLPIILFVEF